MKVKPVMKIKSFGGMILEDGTLEEDKIDQINEFMKNKKIVDIKPTTFKIGQYDYLNVMVMYED